MSSNNEIPGNKEALHEVEESTAQYRTSLSDPSSLNCLIQRPKSGAADNHTLYSSTEEVTTELTNRAQSSSETSEISTSISTNVSNDGNKIQSLSNLKIKNSSNVIIGHITYLAGPVHINRVIANNVQFATGCTARRDQLLKPNKTTLCRPEKDSENECPCLEGFELRIFDRIFWLAEKPAQDYEYIANPVPYVVICHTATEMPETQNESLYFVKNIQSFHIHSRRWNDISYNFLIGGCGFVYEGRGWKAVGNHSAGYNAKSVGVSFMGCFMKELPPHKSLVACKVLIKKGIELGYISPNYKLIAHNQCFATESPGKMLFEELKTWPHFASGTKIN